MIQATSPISSSARGIGIKDEDKHWETRDRVFGEGEAQSVDRFHIRPIQFKLPEMSKSVETDSSS